MIKNFRQFITEELRKVVSNVSGSGKTKHIEWIWDEPSSAKSPSAGISLRDELRELEFQDLINTMSDDKFEIKSKSQLRKEKFKRKDEKLSVTINNLKFLKHKLRELGELNCEYCGKGPLVIYDITEDDIRRGPQKVDGRLRLNVKFNPKDGATCDHKQPMSKGGDKFDYDNLAVCCYRCNQKKGNMTWEQWSDVMKNKSVTEASSNLKNQRLISDLFLSVADEYNIKECEWNTEGSGSWLCWYRDGSLISHFDLQNYTSGDSWILRIFLRGQDQDKFQKDIYSYTDRLSKFGFTVHDIDSEEYGLYSNSPSIGRIYTMIIKSNDKIVSEERMIDISVFMSDLTGVNEEEIEDQLLEITDKFDLSIRPGLFLIDQNGNLKTNKEGVLQYTTFPDVEVQNINGNLKLIPTQRYESDYAWGWTIEIWRRGEITSRENRICSKSAVEKVYSKVNKTRLEKLGLDSSVALTNSAGSWTTDIYSIIIWSIN